MAKKKTYGPKKAVLPRMLISTSWVLIGLYAAFFLFGYFSVGSSDFGWAATALIPFVIFLGLGALELLMYAAYLIFLRSPGELDRRVNRMMLVLLILVVLAFPLTALIARS